jgi:hypothetical protein
MIVSKPDDRQATGILQACDDIRQGAGPESETRFEPWQRRPADQQRKRNRQTETDVEIEIEMEIETQTGKTNHRFPRSLSGAAEESRTLDLNLGKVALYQLSYCRF